MKKTADKLCIGDWVIVRPHFTRVSKVHFENDKVKVDFTNNITDIYAEKELIEVIETPQEFFAGMRDENGEVSLRTV